MENKYYTPKIEEFHIGFRYEMVKQNKAHYYPNPPSNWHRFTHGIKSISLTKLDMEIIEKRCRVKYLDQQDIEELGWKFNYKIKDGLSFGGLDNHTLLLVNKEYMDRVLISWKDITVFRGEVKNYNELKRIMQQIQLLDE